VVEETHDDHLAEHPDERLVINVDFPELGRPFHAHERVRRQERVEVDPPRFHVPIFSERSSVIVRASRIAAPVGSLLK